MALANNPVWAGKGKDRQKRLAELTGLLGAAGLVGGALLAAADRDGKPSFSWRREANRRHKEALKGESGAMSSTAMGSASLSDGGSDGAVSFEAGKAARHDA